MGKCTACGTCMNNCPAEAIHMDKGHTVIDDKKIYPVLLLPGIMPGRSCKIQKVTAQLL
ncbi:4Fe-4S dicluster domain-containing protein [Methanohalophilus sp. WG1-DM]|uniref:4Fe-4S dicluster domain-containing protein n=1 Tax=Methanohalophilus sp. WG1-DM TaxID=2491675 RepID=UPI0013E8DD98|nr:4Fe-4S binding protein [Methanohalophilus sp. WG1-DM]